MLIKRGNRKNGRITVISALLRVNNQLLAPMYFEGNTNTEVFNTWVEHFLIKELTLVKFMIMDNASFYCSIKIRFLIESVGCKLLYLPPYFVDFNPI